MSTSEREFMNCPVCGAYLDVTEKSDSRQEWCDEFYCCPECENLFVYHTEFYIQSTDVKREYFEDGNGKELTEDMIEEMHDRYLENKKKKRANALLSDIHMFKL